MVLFVVFSITQFRKYCLHNSTEYTSSNLYVLKNITP